ncbi:MAG: hypothetical protein SV760_07370, partial [Halobacteria archaeon]|nr:hypothetical protein [Halobacteria archaeon]
ALPFFKEWSSRPGKYDDALTSFGHAGSADVKTTPKLIQIKDGCKRSFVHGGGLYWEGGGKDAISKKAVKKEENLKFSFAEGWFGYGDRGSMCTENVPDRPYILPTKSSAYWVKQDSLKTRQNKPGVRRAEQDPLGLTYTPSDRFYTDDATPPLSGYTKLSTLDAELKAKSGAVAESNFSGSLGATNYFDYEAGNFPGSVDIDLSASGSSTVKYAVLHRLDTFSGSLGQGTTEEVGTSTTVSDEGEYALEVAVDKPNKKPSVAVIKFDVVSQTDLRDNSRYPGGVRNHVEYKLRGFDPSGASYVPTYDYKGSRHMWKLTEGGSSRFVHRADQPYTFKSEVTPGVTQYYLNDVVHSINLELDGKPIDNREKITEPGTHNLTIYACFHAGGDCKDEYFDGTTPSSTSQSTQGR